MNEVKSDVEAIEYFRTKYGELYKEIGKVIVGQDAVIREVLISIFSRGHCLLVGVPGLAKTLLVNTIADALGLSFNRIQFTPDLMPSDIIGSEILDESRNFKFVKGPLFANVILADEINRTPPKTQAALLEAMQETAVTTAGTRYPLDKPFFVLATQNPIEQEGTYPLPEAQLDRFLMQVNVAYPDADAEAQILKLARNEASGAADAPPPAITQETVFAARKEVLALHMAPAVEEYIVQLVIATRCPDAYDQELAGWLEFGGSPRATIALDRCARANAYLQGRDYVSPDYVQTVVTDCLKHRLILSFEAEAAGVTRTQVITRLIEQVPVG